LRIDPPAAFGRLFLFLAKAGASPGGVACLLSHTVRRSVCGYLLAFHIAFRHYPLNFIQAPQIFHLKAFAKHFLRCYLGTGSKRFNK